MVRAILDGTKTQTRRIVKPQPSDPSCQGVDAVWGYGTHRAGKHIGKFMLHAAFAENGKRVDRYLPSPYGQPGDQLWVRESFFEFGHWQEIAGVKTKHGRQKWRFVPASDCIHYLDSEDAPKEFRKGRHHKDPYTNAWHLRLARFMPRRFSRITLEVTGVRVERLQEISDEDAKAEGYMSGADAMESKIGYRKLGPFSWYYKLWESINGPGSWDANPYVWAITFKRIQP